MTKVRFIKELQSGEPIVLPGGGPASLRLAGSAPFARVTVSARKPNDVLHALVASHKQRSKN